MLEIAIKFQRMSGQHTLFFSMRCRFCQAFLEELSKTPFKGEFRLFCVDGKERGTLPTWLKSVPTLVLAGKSSAEALVGPGPVNNWLFERKMGGGAPKAPTNAFESRAPLMPPVYKPEVAPRPAATARMAAPSGGAAPAPTGDDSILAYHGAEMGGGKWSDTYSFLEDTEFQNFSSEKGYNRIGRNFESLIPSGGLLGSGGAAAAAGPKRSPKEEAQQSALEAFMAARDRDVSGPIKRM